MVMEDATLLSHIRRLYSQSLHSTMLPQYHNNLYLLLNHYNSLFIKLIEQLCKTILTYFIVA